ncbi:MAG: hypothetical protein J6V93_02335 [Clostridia bacterium]|nr:hypothetical protein [Clostridia bacterium]
MNSKKFAFRAIATLLCFVMLIGMIPVYVAAADEYVVEIGNVTIDTATAEAVDGYYTVSVPINLTTNGGLMNFSADVTYDEALDLTGWTENGQVFPYMAGIMTFNLSSKQEADLEANPYRVYISAPTVETQFYTTGQLMALTFKVPETIKAGDYPISIDVVSLLSQDDSQITKPTTEKKSVTKTVAGKVTVVAKEEPVDPNAPLLLVEAADLNVTSGGNMQQTLVEATGENGLPFSYYHLDPGSVTTLGDGTRYYVEFTNDTVDFDDGIYVKVGYRKNVGNTFLAPMFDGKRLWDNNTNAGAFSTLNAWTETVVNLNQDWSGGEGDVGALVKDIATADGDTAALVKDGYKTNGLLIRPWGSEGGVSTSAYMDIAYIALFSDADKAAAYTRFEKTNVVFMNGDEVFDTIEHTIGDYVKLPTAIPTQEGVNFVEWDIEKNAVVTGEMTVNAVFSEEVAATEYVFNAYEVTGDRGGIIAASKYVPITATDPAYIRYTANAGTVEDTTRMYVKFTEDNFPATFSLNDFPILRVDYRTNKGGSSEVNYNPVYGRLWGVKSSGDFVNDDNWNFVTYNLAEITGGNLKENNAWTGPSLTTNEMFATVADGKIKAFFIRPSGSLTTDFYFDIAHVGFFKTVEDANAYEYEKIEIEPEYLFDANDFTVTDDGNAVSGNHAVEFAEATEATPAYYHVTEGNLINVNHDRARIFVNIPTSEFALDFKAADAPIVKVGYRTNTANTTTQDWNPLFNTEKAARLWGTTKFAVTNDGQWHSFVLDLSAQAYSGGENVTGTTTPEERWAYVSEYQFKALLLRPFKGVTLDNADFYYDILYVALFDDINMANAYEFPMPEVEAPKTTVTFKSGDEIFSTAEVEVGSDLVYPATSPEAPAGYAFKGWDVAAGTAVTEEMVVNAIFAEIISGSEDGYIVLDNSAFALTLAKDFDGVWGATIDADTETGITTLSITKEVEIIDGHRFYVSFPDTAIKMREYPYIAVGVRAEKIPGTTLDWDINTDNGGRMWGISWAPAIGTEIAKLVIPVSAYTAGGYPDGSYDDANRDDDTYLKFEIRPGNQGQSTVVGEKIAFEYVAFFKTEAEANAYVFGAEMTNVTFMVDGAEYVKVPYAVGAELVYPEAPVVEGKKFTGWDVAEGTEVTEDMVVTASFVEATPVTFVANGETFATLNIVEGEGLTYPETTPKATNKKFVKWDVEAGETVFVGMTVNAVFADIEAPIAVASGRNMGFTFNGTGTPGIFMNGKGFTRSTVSFDVNGDQYTDTVYDPEFAWVPTTGTWKFVEDIKGQYGADGSQYITAYVNLPADADYLQVAYALKATNGVYTDGITIITDAGEVVVPATYENIDALTTMVLDVTALPEGAKNIRAIKFDPWLRGAKIANNSYFELAYVAAFGAKEDAEPYAPAEEYVVPAQYNVTINPAENGTVYYNYYDEVVETITDAYYAGENVYLRITPAEGYLFAGWLNGDEKITPVKDDFYWGDRDYPKYGTTHSVEDTGAVFTVAGELNLTAVFVPEVQPVHVAVTATTNGTFAMTTEEFGAADGLTTWDADINPGSEVTFVAAADAGYKLDGWYNIADGKNILLSKDATYVLTVGEKNAMIEVRFMDETITIATKLAVETDGNGKVSVAGGEAVENYFDYANGGDNVALTPVANEGYVFAYWTRKSADGTEAFIDAEAEVEVAPLGAEVAYVANFVAEGETATIYVDAQDIVLSKTEEPAVPGRLGYVAGEWKEIITLDNVAIFQPTYVRADTTYTLTITYADGSVDTVEFKYDEGVAVIGKADSSVWTLTVGEGNPIVISYENQFTLGTAFTTDATLVEAENTEEAQAIVNAISAVYDAGANQIKFTATFELPEGATLVERGVLLTSDASVAAEMEIGTAGVIVGKIKKPVDNATKVFIINKSNVATGATWYGRPYIIYTANGVTETLYATTISATAE